MEKSDIELVRAAAAGDTDAYAAFVRRHATAAMRYCVSRLADRQAAEDATQEAMLRVYEQVCVGRIPRDPVSWLFSVARNCCNELARRRRRSEAVPLPGDAEARGPVPESRPDLADLLEQLTDAERGLIHMKYTERLTCREIAARTGKPIGTVKAALSRAYGKLRRHLAPEQTEEKQP